MTVITNPDPTVFSATNNFDADVRAFFDTTLGIDLTGKSLSIGQDTIGRIMSIDVDPTVSMTGPQITQVQDEFFNMMSIDSIIAALGTAVPALATVFLTDQGHDTPAVITITTQDELTDLTVVGGWNIGADHPLFTLVDADTGEIRYDGTTARIFTIHYAATMGVTNQFDHIYLSLMRTPDAGVKAEIVESRLYLETINGSEGMPLSNSVTFKLDPLDKIKINGANGDGTTNLQITVGTMAIK